MIRSLKQVQSERGWTFVELLITVAIMAIITPAITFLFAKVTQGMAADEMHGQLKKLNEETLLRIHVRVSGNKHMFQNNASGNAFIALRAPSAGAPATILGTQMATTQGGTTITFSPTVGATPTAFGNSLFFAGYDSPTTISNQAYLAPITVSGVSVTFGGGTPATIVFDVYRFYYFYLATSTHPLRNVNSYNLVEWRSVQFVDYNQLNSITDLTLKARIVQWLSKSGPANFAGGPITRAWDSAQLTTAAAFYTLDNATGNVTSNNAPTLPEADWTYLTKVPSGLLSSGFRYGISGNTSGWKDAPSGAVVPAYGTAAGVYPGGFEVGFSGSSAGLQVLTRCLLVAQGGAPRVAWNDITMIHNAKDVW